MVIETKMGILKISATVAGELLGKNIFQNAQCMGLKLPVMNQIGKTSLRFYHFKGNMNSYEQTSLTHRALNNPA